MTEATELNAAKRKILLEVARLAIEHELIHNRPCKINLDKYEPQWRQKRGSFVTLRVDEKLRGCIGSVEAQRPLLEDVAHNARAAATQDPRFDPVQRRELAQLRIHISVLSPLEEIACRRQEDLLAQLRPGFDGLVLEGGGQRATLLPAVWEQVSDSALFLRHLKHKAGLPLDYWSDDLRVWRYEAESVEE